MLGLALPRLSGRGVLYHATMGYQVTPCCWIPHRLGYHHVRIPCQHGIPRRCFHRGAATSSRPPCRFVSDEIELLSQLIRQGDYVVDAGAHVGAVTVPLARIVGAQGKVLWHTQIAALHAAYRATR